MGKEIHSLNKSQNKLAETNIRIIVAFIPYFSCIKRVYWPKLFHHKPQK